MPVRTLWLWGALLALTIALSGCSSSPESESDSTGSDEEKRTTLLEPFTPPTLDELEAKVEWKDQPVLNAMDLLRNKQAGEEPLTTVEEALALKNNSPEDNAKIVSALGRVWTAPEQVNWDATISRHLGGDVKSTNPLFMSSTAEFEVAGLTSFGLFGFDWNMEAFAAAESVVSWQTSTDGMYDKVVMRDDLTWSDGHPITAHDIAFSFQLIMDPRVDVPAVRSGTSKLRWVHAYDDHTLVYFHKEPLATNIWNVNFPVLPKHIYGETRKEDPTLKESEEHVRLESEPISGGPYEITSRVRGQEVVLSRRESYYMHNGEQVRDKPPFKTIRFRVVEDSNTAILALKSGEIDEMALTPEQWTTQTIDDAYYEHNTKASGTAWVYFYFGWNLETPEFSDVRVRKAMSYAFDYDEMLDSLFYGLYEQSVGPAHPTAWFAPQPAPKPYEQDLAAAEALLTEAGWTDSDGDGIRDKMIDGELVKFEFTIFCSNTPTPVALCTLLKQSLDKIGVVCNVRSLEFTVLQERTLSKRFEAFLGGWGTGTDPDTADNLWGTDARRNYVSYSNPEVDKLFEQGRREFDKAKRAEIYRKINEILWEAQPYTWLYFRNSFYAFNKKLRGYNFSPRGPYNYSPGFSSIWIPAAAE